MIIAGRRDIDEDAAQRLERAIPELDADYWLKMQSGYDNRNRKKTLRSHPRQN